MMTTLCVMVVGTLGTGGGGIPPSPQILENNLTLIVSEGADNALFSDFQTFLRLWTVSWLEQDCNRDRATTAQYLAISLTSNSHESHSTKNYYLFVWCIFFDSPLGK